jgi:hypothetical protein
LSIVTASDPLRAGSVSLYFGLEKGQRADLEIVAIAALEWVESARAAAREIDPTAEIRIELINAAESSLRFNVVLDWIETQLARIDEGSGQYWRIRRLAVALAIFVPTVGYPTFEFYFGDKAAQFSEEDRHALHEILDTLKKNPDVVTHRQNFFKTVESDKSITGAGISEGHSDPPVILVPRNQFPEQSGVWQLLGSDDERDRTTFPLVDVTLVSPALVPTPRSWTFQPPGLPEFTATMRDRHFLAALEHNHVRERLRVGIAMKLRLEVKEKKVDGFWKLKRGGRSVIEVISPKVE